MISDETLILIFGILLALMAASNPVGWGY